MKRTALKAVTRRNARELIRRWRAQAESHYQYREVDSRGWPYYRALRQAADDLEQMLKVGVR